MKKLLILIFVGLTGFLNIEIKSSTLTQRLADSMVIDGLKHRLSPSNLQEFLDQTIALKYTAGVSTAFCGVITTIFGLYLIKRIMSKNEESTAKAGIKTGLAAIFSTVFGILTGCSLLRYNVFDQILRDCGNVAKFSATVIRLIAMYGRFK